jgi:redox-sensitive bicupin YhaK (pirin superfamily)
VARGAVAANGTALAEGDGAAISGEDKVTIVAGSPAEVLFFDLA